MKRITPDLSEAYYFAKAHKFSHPLGRAAYLVNRYWNGGMSKYRRSADANLECMRAMKEETAKRWEAHVHSGGSLKTLRCTREEWLAERRVRYAERTAEMKARAARRNTEVK